MRRTGTVLSVTPDGDLVRLMLGVPDLGQRFRPGQFVSVAVGGTLSGTLLRRSYWLHRATRGGTHGGTVEVVLDPTGRGTSWLAARAPKDEVGLIGPLGRPYSLPREPVTSVVVGQGYAAAAIVPLVTQLRSRGCAVHALLGGLTAAGVLGVLDVQKAASSVQVATADGSLGVHGDVTELLEQTVQRTGAQVLYAAGPRELLSTAAAVAQAHGVWSQCAIEEPMACGTGTCQGCVVPVRGDDAITRMVRSCVEGPVFRGDRVLWDELGTIPAATLGASS